MGVGRVASLKSTSKKHTRFGMRPGSNEQRALRIAELKQNIRSMKISTKEHHRE
jgi:hypothetical protein